MIMLISLKWARRKKQIRSFKVSYGSWPYYYLHHVLLPVLIKYSVVELVVPNGGCLQIMKKISTSYEHSCPLIVVIIGILLRAYGYSCDTIKYVVGGEVFGGQRSLVPLHAMFENVVDRTSLSTEWKLAKM